MNIISLGFTLVFRVPGFQGSNVPKFQGSSVSEFLGSRVVGLSLTMITMITSQQ